MTTRPKTMIGICSASLILLSVVISPFSQGSELKWNPDTLLSHLARVSATLTRKPA